MSNYDVMPQSSNKNESSTKREQVQLHQNTRSASQLTLADIKPFFQLPLHQASIQLNVDQRELKKRLRELGVPRWPYRKRKVTTHFFEEEISSKDNNKLFNCFRLDSKSTPMKNMSRIKKPKLKKPSNVNVKVHEETSRRSPPPLDFKIPLSEQQQTLHVQPFQPKQSSSDTCTILPSINELLHNIEKDTSLERNINEDIESRNISHAVMQLQDMLVPFHYHEQEEEGNYKEIQQDMKNQDNTK